MFKKAKFLKLILALTLLVGTVAPIANEQALASTGDRSYVDEGSSLANEIIDDGEKYYGTPYDFGAPYGQTETFDCSSLMKTIFAENGIDLPRTSRQQAQVGEPISRSELQKGDLVFFSTSDSNGRIAHVGVYAGNGKLLHTWGPGGVRLDNMNSGWLDDSYITARRVL